MTRQTAIIWGLFVLGLILLGWVLLNTLVFSAGQQP